MISLKPSLSLSWTIERQVESDECNDDDDDDDDDENNDDDPPIPDTLEDELIDRCDDKLFGWHLLEFEKFTGNSNTTASTWVPQLREVNNGAIQAFAPYLSNVQFVYNFDWNISVESIRSSQQAAMMRVVNQLGETAGMALGGLVCSALPGMAQVEINPEIFARTWYLIRDDVKEEILDSYAELILATKNAAKFMAFLETFKNTRDFIRNNVRTGFKGIDDKISKWGLEGKPWILSEKVEEAIESIPNDKVREFTENVLDGFIETCGMIYPQMNVISV